MFTTDPTKLYAEIDKAITMRDEPLESLDKMIEYFHGQTYGGKKASLEQSTVNHSAIWLSIMLPRLIYRNPKVLVGTRKSIDGNQSAIEANAQALEAFLNVWVKSQKLAKKLKNSAMEYSFAWCFGMVTRRKHPGDPTQDTEAERYLPEFVRVPIWRMIVDPHCEQFEDARFVGHTWYGDKDDLIKTAKAADEDDGWVVPAVEALEPAGGSKVQSRFETRDASSNDREEVHLIDIWIPEKLYDEDVGPEDGFHGTIMTLGWDSNKESTSHIRKPRPYYGPPTGPYAMGGYMSVPTKVFPLGPLMITKEHEDLLREMIAHANRSCSEYRKVILVPGGTNIEAAAKKAAIGKNQIIVVPGMAADAKPIVVEVGGVTDQQLRNIAYSRNELENTSGLDASGSGNVTGDSTATENAIADQARQTISGHVVDNFHQFVNDILEKSAWYGFHDEDIEIPITDDVDGLEEFESPVFVGGTGELDTSAFAGMSIDIEAMSMERTNDALNQRRVMQVMQLVSQIAPMVRQFPEVKWKMILGRVGDALNMPDLEDAIDFDMAMQLMGVPAQPDGGEQEQGLGVDAGLNDRNFDEQEKRETLGKITGALANVQGVA